LLLLIHVGDDLAFEAPHLLLLLLRLPSHLLHQRQQFAHVSLNPLHIIVEVVNHFEGRLGLRDTKSVISLDNFLILSELAHLISDCIQGLPVIVRADGRC